MNSFSQPQQIENYQKFFPYNLKGEGNSSDIFYSQLEIFTEIVTNKGLKKFKGIISEIEEKRENRLLPKENIILPSQNIEDDLLDLLLFGTLWNLYKGKWGNLITVKHAILETLFRARKKYTSLKHNIDGIRGKLISKWLDRKQDNNIKPSLKNIHRFVLWLSATGDFREESKRIEKLIDLLSEYPNDTQILIIEEVLAFAEWFESESKQMLGNYTSGVEEFLKTHHQNYKGSEDYFFCGRREVEYHLNMVGAEIMNKSLRKEFLRSENKILLLPTCMVKNKKCKAEFDGLALKCRHCTVGCNISKTTLQMEKVGVATVLIKHSSDFSKWLLPWANQTETALIGTACVLNLLQGGFEMKKLGISSQCVFLDYCGCKKHWDKKGIPTEINIKRTQQIAQNTNTIFINNLKEVKNPLPRLATKKSLKADSFLR
jgi:uncharacterized protein